MPVAHLARSDAVRSFANKSGGFITSEELANLGVPSSTISRWCIAGLLFRFRQGIYRTSEGGFGFEEAVHRATKVKTDRQAVGGRNALTLWVLPGGSRGKIVIVGPKNRRSISEHVVSHQYRDLRPVDITRRDGVSVTTALRSVIDATRLCGPTIIGQQLTAAVGQGLSTYNEIGQRLAEVSRPGKRGLAKLRKVLTTRFDMDERMLNSYELRAKRLFGSLGVAPPVAQFEVSYGARTYFVDFAWPAHNLFVECDSMLAHSTPEQRQSDLRRQNDLIGLGWSVVRFTYSDIGDRPDYVARMLSRHM